MIRGNDIPDHDLDPKPTEDAVPNLHSKVEDLKEPLREADKSLKWFAEEGEVQGNSQEVVDVLEDLFASSWFKAWRRTLYSALDAERQRKRRKAGE